MSTIITQGYLHNSLVTQGYLGAVLFPAIGSSFGYGDATASAQATALASGSMFGQGSGAAVTASEVAFAGSSFGTSSSDTLAAARVSATGSANAAAFTLDASPSVISAFSSHVMGVSLPYAQATSTVASTASSLAVASSGADARLKSALSPQMAGIGFATAVGLSTAFEARSGTSSGFSLPVARASLLGAFSASSLGVSAATSTTAITISQTGVSWGVGITTTVYPGGAIILDWYAYESVVMDVASFQREVCTPIGEATIVDVARFERRVDEASGEVTVVDTRGKT